MTDLAKIYPTMVSEALDVRDGRLPREKAKTSPEILDFLLDNNFQMVRTEPLGEIPSIEEQRRIGAEEIECPLCHRDRGAQRQAWWVVEGVENHQQFLREQPCYCLMWRILTRYKNRLIPEAYRHVFLANLEPSRRNTKVSYG